MFTCRPCAALSLKRLVVDPLRVAHDCFGAMPFKLQGGPPAAKKPKIPLASALSFVVKPVPPPEIVKKMLLPEPERLIAVDVETHALIPDQPKGSWWQEGRFDIDTTVGDSDIASLRVIQVGWTYGPLGTAEPVTKVRLVRPRGFTIDKAATGKHHISQEAAIAQGVPLESVLGELVEDAEAVCCDNGRIAGHHFGPLLPPLAGARPLKPRVVRKPCLR